MGNTFKALRIFEEDGKYIQKIVDRNITDLPNGDVLIKVEYSSLNYKDALSCDGNKGVTRNYPHTPGIDAVGRVAESTTELFKTGDKVIVTSYDLGMNTDGGLAQYIRVPAEWVVALPANLSMREAMVMGTAGFTAAMSVDRLLKAGQTPDMGKVIVTGALGGVGSIAAGMLAKLGFDVIAASSSIDNDDNMLADLGITNRVDSSTTNDESGRPMLRPQWSGAIDVVGGNTLVTLLKGCAPMGNVTCCGNIGSGDLNMTVYPFILRGVSLIGIDSQNCPMAIRKNIWDNIANNWYPESIENHVIETTLDEVGKYITIMLEKKSRARVIVKC